MKHKILFYVKIKNHQDQVAQILLSDLKKRFPMIEKMRVSIYTMPYPGIEGESFKKLKEEGETLDLINDIVEQNKNTTVSFAIYEDDINKPFSSYKVTWDNIYNYIQGFIDCYNREY